MNDQPALSLPSPPPRPDPAPATDDAGEPLDWAPDDLAGEDVPFDPGISDDPGGDWIPEEDPWALAEEPLADAPDDADADSFVEEVALEAEIESIGEEVLRARLPEHGIELEARIDLARERSVWIVRGRAPSRATELAIELGVLSGRLVVLVEAGERPMLLLGRDALAIGRDEG
jgi:hypothetical protein